MIRGGLHDIQAALDDNETGKAMKVLYPQLQRWTRLFNLLQEGRPGPAETAPVERVGDSVGGVLPLPAESPLGLFR